MLKFRQSRKEEENGGDDTNIQIITSSDGTSSLSHEQTPVEATPAAASSQNENIGLNEMTPEVDLSSLKRDLNEYAVQGNWYQAQVIYDKSPEMVCVPLTASGDTALHVAVGAGRDSYAEELVYRMTPKDLEIRNAYGNTALIMATIAGKKDLVDTMVTKNYNLAVIPGHDGMLPVHLAASSGYHDIVQDLSSRTLLEKMASNFKDIERLFLMTIKSSMYDVATRLFEKYPAKLAIASDDKEPLTALHILARKYSEEFDKQGDNNNQASSTELIELQLLKKLWSQVRQLEYNKIEELISKSSALLFDAVKSGNIEVLKCLLYSTPELLTIKEPDKGRSLLHYAVLYRRIDIFNDILEMKTVNLIIRAEDNDRNNVLHFAALQPEASSLTSEMQLQKELSWFKEVEKRVPGLKKMRNSKGKTPDDLFYDKRKKFSDDVKEATQGIANSGMVVATLIVSVAFAAALAVPSDKTNGKFIVFHLSNAIALFTSAASIISFLTIFTSRFTESESIISVHSSLILGLVSLFISIIGMVIAFAAASFLIFDHRSKWVACVVASMVLIPILIFLVLQFKLLDSLLYKIWSRYYHLSK